MFTSQFRVIFLRGDCVQVISICLGVSSSIKQVIQLANIMYSFRQWCH